MHKEIVFEDLLRWRAAAPLEVKEVRIREDIGAVVIHADGDVAHEPHADLGAVGAQLPPLREGDPLHPRMVGGLRSLGIHAGAGIGRPVVPHLVAMLVDERAEDGVVLQPRGLGLAKGREGLRAGLVLAETRKGELQQLRLHAACGGEVHQIAAEVLAGLRGGDVGRRELRQRVERNFQQHWIERHGADGVVGAVVRPGFVDGQQLDKADPMLRRPVHELPQRPGIANAKVMVMAEGKNRREDASGAFGGHSEAATMRWTASDANGVPGVW